MKTVSKRAVAALIVAIIAVGPPAVALPRDHADRSIPNLIRLIKKVFSISSTSDNPLPPRP